MSTEPRKATDVLLDLETKVDLLLNIIRSQDLNIKIISNKLNDLIKNNQSINFTPSGDKKPIIDNLSVNIAENKQISISAEDTLPIEHNPVGFRRTSRPETYAGDDSYLKSPKKKPSEAEVIVPQQAQQQAQPIQQPINQPNQNTNVSVNSVPVIQRVVDKNGKSVFLADVEIINPSNGEKHKTRTNGAGKWMASLAPGNYKVILSKRESLTKEKIEIIQDVMVDGNTAPLELKMLILK